MLNFGRNAASDPSKIVKSAQFVQEEVNEWEGCGLCVSRA